MRICIWSRTERFSYQISSTDRAKTIDDIHKNKTIHNIFSQNHRLLLKRQFIFQKINSLGRHLFLHCHKSKNKSEMNESFFDLQSYDICRNFGQQNLDFMSFPSASVHRLPGISRRKVKKLLI